MKHTWISLNPMYVVGIHVSASISPFFSVLSCSTSNFFCVSGILSSLVRGRVSAQIRFQTSLIALVCIQISPWNNFHPLPRIKQRKGLSSLLHGLWLDLNVWCDGNKVERTGDVERMKMTMISVSLCSAKMIRNMHKWPRCLGMDVLRLSASMARNG